MITILILEDDNNKLTEIYNTIKKNGISKNYIRHVDNVRSAKEELDSHRFDLLILDINTPLYDNQESIKDGGTTLLKYITKSSSSAKKPTHIVGLTAYKEIKAKETPYFESLAWTIIEYSPRSDEWSEALSNKITHICNDEKAKEEERRKKYDYDVCILTALENPELSAVRSLDLEWKILEIEGDHALYHEAELQGNNRTIKIVAATTAEMGIAASSALTTKMAMTFKPQYIWMLGICAGIKGKVNIGDIIIADRCWNYESGKYKENADGDITFEPDPYQENVSHEISSKLSFAANDEDLYLKIKQDYRERKPSNDLSAHLGPIGSGSAVVSSEKFLAEVKKQNRKLIGIEMEAYGVLSAAKKVPDPKPIVIIAKSVCDFADDQKNDDYQEYAAYTSSSFFINFTRKYLLQ